MGTMKFIQTILFAALMLPAVARIGDVASSSRHPDATSRRQRSRGAHRNDEGNPGQAQSRRRIDKTDDTPTKAPLFPTKQLPPEGQVSVRIDVVYDEYPMDTGWSISQNDTVLIDYPQGSFNESGLVSERVNLSPGEYNFTLTDGFGDGMETCYCVGQIISIYAEFESGDVVLAQINDEFDQDITVPFVVLSEPPPDPVPPPAGYFTVRVDIVYDLFPQEIEWSITQNDTALIRFPGGSLSKTGLVSERLVLSPGEYDFVLTDSNGDGIYLSCSSQRSVAIYAEFEDDDVGDVLLAANEGSFQDRVALPFEVPSSPPEPTPPPEGKALVRIDLVYDEFFEDTAWSIVQNGTVFVNIAQGTVCHSGLISEKIYLVPGNYEFILTDKWGDGIFGCPCGDPLEPVIVIYAEFDTGDVVLAMRDGQFDHSLTVPFVVPSVSGLSIKGAPV